MENTVQLAAWLNYAKAAGQVTAQNILQLVIQQYSIKIDDFILVLLLTKYNENTTWISAAVK